jgi:hypothetical protein
MNAPKFKSKNKENSNKIFFFALKFCRNRYLILKTVATRSKICLQIKTLYYRFLARMNLKRRPLS